jgi:hypothetical protein
VVKVVVLQRQRRAVEQLQRRVRLHRQCRERSRRGTRTSKHDLDLVFKFLDVFVLLVKQVCLEIDSLFKQH